MHIYKYQHIYLPMKTSRQKHAPSWNWGIGVDDPCGRVGTKTTMAPQWFNLQGNEPQKPVAWGIQLLFVSIRTSFYSTNMLKKKRKKNTTVVCSKTRRQLDRLFFLLHHSESFNYLVFLYCSSDCKRRHVGCIVIRKKF